MTRAILIKDIIDVFSEATQPKLEPQTFETEELKKAFYDKKWQCLVDNVNEEKLLALLAKKLKFKFVFDSVGRHMSMNEQLYVIEMFKKFPFKNEYVDLENPEMIFRVVENA